MGVKMRCASYKIAGSTYGKWMRIIGAAAHNLGDLALRKWVKMFSMQLIEITWVTEIINKNV